MKVGVLALQGGFAAHCAAVKTLGHDIAEVRVEAELDALDALVLPGGESTTVSMALADSGLGEGVKRFHGSGKPILATCAGMILCSDDHLGLLEMRVRRNAFGRQLASFETEIEVEGLGGEPFRAVFIRAPWVEEHGESVEVIASHEGHPVAVRSGAVTACSFHPELTDDVRIHRLAFGGA